MVEAAIETRRAVSALMTHSGDWCDAMTIMKVVSRFRILCFLLISSCRFVVFVEVVLFSLWSMVMVVPWKWGRGWVSVVDLCMFMWLEIFVLWCWWLCVSIFFLLIFFILFSFDFVDYELSLVFFCHGLKVLRWILWRLVEEANYGGFEDDGFCLFWSGRESWFDYGEEDGEGGRWWVMKWFWWWFHDPLSCAWFQRLGYEEEFGPGKVSPSQQKKKLIDTYILTSVPGHAKRQKLFGE